MHSKKKKDQVIILRLTAEEKQRAAKLATKRGATISGLIRSLLEKKEIIEMTWQKSKTPFVDSERRFAADLFCQRMYYRDCFVKHKGIYIFRNSANVRLKCKK